MQLLQVREVVAAGCNDGSQEAEAEAASAEAAATTTSLLASVTAVPTSPAAALQFPSPALPPSSLPQSDAQVLPAPTTSDGLLPPPTFSNGVDLPLSTSLEGDTSAVAAAAAADVVVRVRFLPSSIGNLQLACVMMLLCSILRTHRSTATAPRCVRPSPHHKFSCPVSLTTGFRHTQF